MKTNTKLKPKTYRASPWCSEPVEYFVREGEAEKYLIYSGGGDLAVKRRGKWIDVKSVVPDNRVRGGEEFFRDFPKWVRTD